MKEKILSSHKFTPSLHNLLRHLEWVLSVSGHLSPLGMKKGLNPGAPSHGRAFNGQRWISTRSASLPTAGTYSEKETVAQSRQAEEPLCCGRAPPLVLPSWSEPLPL